MLDNPFGNWKMSVNSEFLIRKNALMSELGSLDTASKDRFAANIRSHLLSEKYMKIPSWKWAISNGSFSVDDFNLLQLVNMKAKLDTILETGMEPPDLKEHDPV